MRLLLSRAVKTCKKNYAVLGLGNSQKLEKGLKGG
jgi:hypothetical protein